MQEFLPFIVIGIATGAVYGLAGVGLVLAYKTSGIFNLAYGAIAALTVFVFYWLHDEHGWPWGLAAAVCVLVIGPAEGLLMELVGRALERASATLKVVATVGLLSANAGWIFASRGLGLRALAIFTLLYVLIYLLLRLEDNALLVGAIASFIAVGAAMYFTRHIDWYSSMATGETNSAVALGQEK